MRLGALRSPEDLAAAERQALQRVRSRLLRQIAPPQAPEASHTTPATPAAPTAPAPAAPPRRA